MQYMVDPGLDTAHQMTRQRNTIRHSYYMRTIIDQLLNLPEVTHVYPVSVDVMPRAQEVFAILSRTLVRVDTCWFYRRMYCYQCNCKPKNVQNIQNIG